MHKKIAYGGMATALSVILLVFSAYFPSGKAASLFAASAIVYGFRLVFGVKAALAMYGATAVLGYILTSGASPVISVSFAICFGSYPVLRFITEGRPLFLSVILKSVFYTVYFVLVYGVFKYIVSLAFPISPGLIYIIGAVVFAGYDVLLKYTGDYIVERFFRN